MLSLGNQIADHPSASSGASYVNIPCASGYVEAEGNSIWRMLRGLATLLS